MAEKIKSVVHVWERGNLELRAIQLMDNIVCFQSKPKDDVLWMDCDTLCLADMWALLESAKNWKNPMERGVCKRWWNRVTKFVTT